MKFMTCTEGNDRTLTCVEGDTPSSAAEKHVRGLYNLDDADGSHVVLAHGTDGVTHRFRVYVTMQVHAILAADQGGVVMP